MTFCDDRDRHRFLRALEEATERHGSKALAYCLLDNHYHLVLRSEPEALVRTMHLAGTIYVGYFNRRHGTDGSLWVDRFWSDPISDDERLMTAARYVERNALDVRPDRPPERYQWSSLGAIIGRRRAPAFLDTRFLLERFGGSADHYLRFVTRAFPSDRQRTRTSHVPRWSVGAVETAAEAALRGSDWWASLGRRTASAAKNQMIILLATESADVCAAEMAHHLGLSSAGSVHTLRSRARKREASDPLFASTLRVARLLLRDRA